MGDNICAIGVNETNTGPDVAALKTSTRGWDGTAMGGPPLFSENTLDISKRVHYKTNGLKKNQKTPFFIIPAKAVIQFFQLVAEFFDTGFHRSNDFLRNHQNSLIKKFQPFFGDPHEHFQL
jgi:hypothetical protein